MVCLNNYLFFCDESGNSGSNALDKNQPYYILAGWLIHKNKVKQNIEIIKKYSGKKKELKSTNMLRKLKDQMQAKNMIKELLDTGSLPVISILEYRFSIAMRIIEFLIDHEYNDKVSSAFEADHMKKKIFASIVYELPDNILEIFFNGYKLYDKKLIIQSVHAIINHSFNSHNELLCKNYNMTEIEYNSVINELKSLLKGCINKLNQNIESQRKCHLDSENNVMKSLNLPMFVVMLQTLQNLALEDNKKIQIIHDSSREFSEGYLKAFNLYANNDQNEIFKFNDGSQIIITNELLKDISFVESQNEYIIQAADIFAGSLNKSLKDKKVLPELYDMTVPFIFLCDKPQLCNPRISTQKLYEIFSGLKNIEEIRSRNEVLINKFNN